MTLKDSWKKSIRSVVSDLVVGRYSAIVEGDRTSRLSPAEVRGAIERYGRTLIDLPPDAFELASVYPVADKPNSAAVDLPFWTREEGRSDLSLLLTISDEDGSLIVELDSIRVQ